MAGVSVSFYCKRCCLDQDLDAAKKSTFRGDEYFFAYCRQCKKELHRYITERRTDPYYQESLKMRKERVMLSKDLIQPGQTGFQTYYRKQWLDIERKKEEYEKKMEAYKKKREGFHQEMKDYSPKQKKAAQLVLKQEEEQYNA